MPYSLNQIKSFKTIDLDNYAVRGAKAGINNSKFTGPLFDDGTCFPYKTVLYGDATVTSGDTTITIGQFNSPYSYLSTSIFDVGDTLVINADSFKVSSVDVGASKVIVAKAPTFTGGYKDSTYSLGDRDFLIEPDVGSNTITKGLAKFTRDSTQVTGTGTDWSNGDSKLEPGDAIQLNTYQKYFIIDTVYNDTTIGLTENFDTDSIGYNGYTVKKWRLGRLAYQYVKQAFTYENHNGRWIYDSTTGGDKTAYETFTDFIDGIRLKFSPSLSPELYPDVMDSNVVLNKVFTRSTENDQYQYALPAVPNPEESLELFIDDNLKDRFPNGNKDYVVNYSQMPTYVYPPAMADRKVANIMFLKGISNITLKTEATSGGVIQFTDGSGNALSGIMPGSETIVFGDTTQVPNSDYVLDIDAGLAYATNFNSEPIVKYVMYQIDGLFDSGVNISKNGVKQKLTIPGNTNDDVQLDFESGYFKPMNQDVPNPGEFYDIEYYTEGEYIEEEAHTKASQVDPSDWFFVDKFPIKYQSLILNKNGVYLDEGVDYRISYLTGRIVFLKPLNLGDVVKVSYSPLIKHTNSIYYENGKLNCGTKAEPATVVSINPLLFTFPNTQLIGSDASVIVQSVINVTKDSTYNVNGYSFKDLDLQLLSDSTNVGINTDLKDVVNISYSFFKEGLEFAPVETIKAVVGEGANYMVLSNQDSTSYFPSGSFVRLNNVDTGGDFYFKDASSVFDGEDTIVYFTGKVPFEIINPTVYVSDSSAVLFLPIPAPTDIVSGSVKIDFTGLNIADNFRAGQLINLGDDYYSIQSAGYDSSKQITSVSLGVQTFTDYTGATLNNVYISDIPLYFAGDQIINASSPIIVDPLAPAMLLNYDGYATASKDSSSFIVETDASKFIFQDSNYSSLYDLSYALQVFANITVTLVDSNVTSWQTAKIKQFQGLSLTNDSTGVIESYPALYKNGFDPTDFSIANGVVTLNNPLVPGDLYDLDYMGLRSLGDSSVTFSGSYFTTLPARSKVNASMRFDNVDQFYIQAMSERTFLETVIEPRKLAEANRQNGNVGQGGDLPGDENSGNSAGGLTSLEFQRVDTVIEDKIYKAIFDFFNGRLQYYADEMLSIKGWRLCNNDGLLSELDSSCGALPINRMYPWADYATMSPAKIACLTGQTVPYAIAGPRKPRVRGYKNILSLLRSPTSKALFQAGETGVTSLVPGANSDFPTYWTHQLRVGDFIKPFDATTNYEITKVVSDSSLSIYPAYLGSTYYYNIFTMTSKFPLYDDDGYTGPKAVSQISENFGILPYDVFDVHIDGSHQAFVFQPTSTLPAPLGNLFPVDNYSAYDVSKQLSSALKIKMTPEWYFDPESEYGYELGLAIRVDGTYNKFILGDGSAVEKLGFSPDTTYTGNNDNTDNNPEFVFLLRERTDCSSQRTISANSLALPKLSRPDSSGIALKNLAGDETTQIYAEMALLNTEIVATDKIILEPTLPGYTNSVTANAIHKNFRTDSSVALAYDTSVVVNYQKFYTPQKWLNRWLDQTDYKTGINGQLSFVVTTNAAYDRRILGDGSTVDNVSYPPIVKSGSTTLDGSWTHQGGLLSGANYTSTNDATFHFDSTPMFYLKQTGTTVYSYYIDTAGLGLTWGSNASYWNYTNYPTIGSLKANINSSTTGLDATGNSIFDSSSSVGLIFQTLTVIAPDATVYSGLRDSTVYYWTVDDKNLIDKSSFDTVRIGQLNSRLAYLDIRESQIRSDVTREEYFRSARGCSGNLFNWADNRFNRSVGSKAQVKQVEKQQEVNKSSKEVSSRFIGGGEGGASSQICSG